MRLINFATARTALKVLEPGDDLERLAEISGVSPNEILAMNGIKARLPSCEAGRAIAEWVLAVSPSGIGGVRLPPDPRNPNKCEPGEGHVAFAVGQVITLPESAPRRTFANSSTAPTSPTAAAGSLLPYAAAAAIGYATGGPARAAIAAGAVFVYRRIAK